MPYFRVRVSDGKTETVIEEKFPDEIRLREQLPKRGWTSILSVEEIAEPVAPAQPIEAPPAPIRADQVREDGDWVYLPPEIAARHPLHGIGGWTAVLLAMLVLGGLVGLWALVQLGQLLRYGGIITVLFVTVCALLSLNVVTLVLLIRRSRAFPTWYIALAVSSIAMTLLTFALGAGVRPADIGNLIGSMVWLCYVLMSRRVNVTFRHRVEREDEWLQQGLAAAGTTVLAAGASAVGVRAQLAPTQPPEAAARSGL